MANHLQVEDHSVSAAVRALRAIVAALILSVLAASMMPLSARADVTPADLAAQPSIMKTNCRNRLGIAGQSACETDAAYAACVAYLKAGRWDSCLRTGQADTQVRRATAAEARAKLLGLKCTELAAGQYRCPDRDFNRSLGYSDCLAYRNGGSVTTCLKRDFLREYAERIDARLRANPPVGYAYAIINSDGERVEGAWGSARKAPDANPLPMAATSVFPTASVSKNITAAATLRALAERGLTVDTPVWTYLPTDWTYSAAFKTITFRGLMRHRSGLFNNQGIRCDEVAKAVDYGAMKTCVQAVQSTQYANRDCDLKPLPDADRIGCYQNLDYAFLRIAIAKLDPAPAAAAAEAQIDKTLSLGGVLGQQFTAARDTAKAKLFAGLYESYVNAKVLGAAGFTSQCRPILGSYEPQVYALNLAKAGTDFGDRSLLCGSEGWVLSARLLAEYLHELDQGNVAPRGSVDLMKSGLMGWEASGLVDTPFGRSQRWWHGGCYNSEGRLCNLSTLVMSYSNGVQLAVIFNSDFPKGRTYGDDVTNAFYETMQP